MTTAYYSSTMALQAPPPPVAEQVTDTRPIQPVQPVYNTTPTGPDRPRRTRRRYEEVPRIYLCNHPECDRGYSTLNHLNTHIANKGHGPKRLPSGKWLCRYARGPC
jgi:hypothetical protein